MVENGTVTLCAYFGDGNTIYIPRKIENKNVTKIIDYCFTFNKATKVYIPSEVITIDATGFDVYVNNSNATCNFYCEVASKPSGWNSNWVYNTRNNSTSYINKHFGTIFEY